MLGFPGLFESLHNITVARLQLANFLKTLNCLFPFLLLIQSHSFLIEVGNMLLLKGFLQ